MLRHVFVITVAMCSGSAENLEVQRNQEILTGFILSWLEVTDVVVFFLYIYILLLFLYFFFLKRRYHPVERRISIPDPGWKPTPFSVLGKKLHAATGAAKVNKLRADYLWSLTHL